MSLAKRLKRHLRPYLPSGRALRDVQDRALRRVRLRRTRDPWPLIHDDSLAYGSVLPLAIADVMLDQPDFTFVQIGAYDGVAHEDLGKVIERRNLRGVLVEPQPGAFARLEELYRDRPGVTLLNAAIDQTRGTRKLYVPPRGDTQVASFTPRHVMKYGFAQRELVVHDVECLTVEDAMGRAGLESIDLLQIDAEGYDHEILRGVDFTRIRPAIIRFEHRHVPPREMEACLRRLAAHGYRFLCEPNDVIALRRPDTGEAPCARAA